MAGAPARVMKEFQKIAKGIVRRDPGRNGADLVHPTVARGPCACDSDRFRNFLQLLHDMCRPIRDHLGH
jgi:hypothetical protein